MPLRRVVDVLRTILSLLLALPAAAAIAAPAPGSDVMPSLGLARMSEQTPLRAAAPGGGHRISVALDGRTVELLLEPYSLRRPDCRAVVEGADGSLTPIQLPSPNTYRGIVRGDAAGVVAATLDGDEIRARIILEDGSDWYVQPIRGGLAGAHAVYRSADIAEEPGTCAADGAPAQTREPSAAPQAQSSGCVDADIAIEADYPYYQWNGSSTTQTINDIDAVMNAVELMYSRDVKIGYRISQYLIQTTGGKYGSSDPNTKLNAFQSWWNANQGSVTRDLAHLMTGPLSGGLLGVAYYSVICNTSYAYGISNTTWSSNWGNRVGVIAHEIGHNWGATHCNGQPDCFVMCANIGGCDADPTRLSTISIREIETLRAQSGTCLSSGSGTPTALNPTARDDRAVTLPGTPATVSVLANDFDPNCQTISVAGVASPTANGGAVSISGDNVVYTPAAGFVGTDTFQYTVRDAGGAQSSAVVTMDVEDYKTADPAAGAVPGLQVRYYHVPPLDANLGSMPAMSNPYTIETVPTLSFPTTSGPVGESGLADRVAARCTGTLDVPASGTYTFYLTASDGAKLYIDEVLRVDNDGLHDMRERSASVSLTAGPHDVRVDYYEATGTAGLRLEIAGASIPRTEIPPSMWVSPGVRIAYYQLDSAKVPPFAALVPENVQSISTINYPFSWGNFAGSGRATDVGAVFEGFLTVPSDKIYSFEITSEDGSRFYIGDKLVVDNDGYHNRVAATGGAALRAGAHKFRLEYFARDGGNMLTIQVWAAGLSKQIVPSSWWSHRPTYHVPTQYASLSAAIAAAPTNSMVWVAAGTYTGSANRNLDFGNKNIALVGGGGPALTILDGQDAGRLFAFTNHTATGALIDGFTLSRGAASGGSGGAISLSNSTLTVRDCYIQGNRSTGPGGAVAVSGASSPIFDTCVISGNHAGGGGGGASADGSSHLRLLACTVGGNLSDTEGGGAFAANGGRVSFDRSILWGNYAGAEGSEAWTADAASTVEFDCSDVRSAHVGGGGTEIFGAGVLITDPLFCAPAPGSQAPTTAGSYRVAASSPVLGAAGSCGGPIGARGEGCATTAVTAAEPVIAVTSTRLAQNAPNPFNPETRIAFTLERAGVTTLRIYDVAGRLIATLVDRDLPAGRHQIAWRGRDRQDRPVGSGVYFYELRNGGEVLRRSMVLLK